MTSNPAAAFFVTATGTEVGKTYVSAQLLRAAVAAGKEVAAVKPLMSGFSADDLAASDAGCLLAAMGRPVDAAAVDAMVAHRFEPALAPNVAARNAGMALDLQALLDFSRARLPQAENGFCLVEGAGGLMSPVTDSHLHSDFIAALGLPVLLVTGTQLGTVSHTLTALRVLDQMQMTMPAIAVSQTDPQHPSADDIAAELARWTEVPAVPVPYGGDADALYDRLFV